MKFLRHTRIGTRLTLAMLLMALATAGIGSIGWLYVARMGDIIRANYQDNVQHVLLLSQADDAFLGADVEWRELLLNPSAADRQTYLAAIGRDNQRLRQSLGEYSRSLLPPEEVAVYAPLSRNLEPYLALRDRSVALLLENRLPEALAVRAQARPLAEALNRQLSQLIAINTGQAEASDQEARAQALGAQRRILLFALLALTAALIIAFLTTRSITCPLAAITAAADGLARGELDRDIAYRSADEIGQLADSFRGSAQAVRQLVDDCTRLSQAAVQGDLRARSDTVRHQGEYGRVMQSVNAAFEAVTAPLNVAAETVATISRGEVPPESPPSMPAISTC